MSRRFYVNRNRAPISSCPSYTPGKYSAEYIDDLVFAQGWIPVATLSEFESIKDGGSVKMGAGTCWEDNYTVGLDKKYIQVSAFDGTLHGVIESLAPTPSFDFTGTYDGNEYFNENINVEGNGSFLGYTSGSVIKNVTVNSGTFLQNFVGNTRGGVMINRAKGCTINNCFVNNCSVGTGTSNQYNIGGFVGDVIEGTTITSCGVNDITISSSTANTNSQSIRVGGFCGTNGITGPATSTISDCYVDGITVSTALWYTGGFVGENNEFGIIEDCYVTNITNFTSRDRSGGFVGYNTFGGIIRRCKVDSLSTTITQVSTDERLGGFAGFNNGGSEISESWTNVNVVSNGVRVGSFCGINNTSGSLISDCHSYGNATGVAASTGGFIGQQLNGADCENCYSTGSSSGGGFIGSNGAGSTANNCYWDTDTSGNATSAAGTGKTTSELQTPTTNSGIYSAWSLTVWGFGTTTDYPELINTP